MRCLILFVALSLTVSARAAGEFVPVDQFAQGPSVSRVRLSPDGRYIASLQEIDSKQWLIVLDLDTKKSFRINPGATVTGLRKTVGSFQWISDRRISFLTTVWEGTGFTGVSAVDCDGKNWVAFTGPDVDPKNPFPLVATQIIHSFGDTAVQL